MADKQIRLKVGGRYLTRDGREAAVTTISLGSTAWPFRGAVVGDETAYDRSWTSDGRYCYDGAPHSLDLVSEYVEPPKFQIEIGKKYLTRDGRIAEVTGPSDGEYSFEGNPEGSSREVWRADGSWHWVVGEEHELDLVSEYVGPAAANEPRYRYFCYLDTETPDRFCVWRHAADEHYASAKFIFRPGDDWEHTGICLEDNLTDPGMVECDENGRPLSSRPLQPESPPVAPVLGLSQLDVFAMAALPAYLTHLSSAGHSVPQYYQEIATESYNIAEAMLTESRIRNGGARA